MNKVVPRNYSWQHQPVLLATLLLLLLLLTACFGGGDEAAPEDAAAPETAVQQTGTLTCGDPCLAQGQCGAATDGRTVILANSGQPTFQNHNALLENNSAVVITNQQLIDFTSIGGGAGSSTFYAVQSPEGGPINWVAGSCVTTNP